MGGTAMVGSLRRAFTLTELLLIGIIGSFAAILLPSKLHVEVTIA